jgi:hypothetical protein
MPFQHVPLFRDYYREAIPLYEWVSKNTPRAIGLHRIAPHDPVCTADAHKRAHQRGSEWQGVKAIYPLFRFRGFLDEQEVFHHGRDGQVLRHQQNACTGVGGGQCGEMPRHGAAVVGDQQAPLACGLGKHRYVIEPCNRASCPV